MNKVILSILFVLLLSSVWAQKYTISGSVEDAANGEKLLGVNIYNENNYQGTSSNNYGFYSLTQQSGPVKLVFSMVGYHRIEMELELITDTVINVGMASTIELDEVVITDSEIREKVKSSQMSVTEVPVKMVQKLPVFMGEMDLIKTIQLLPGVQSGSEGSSGFYVRGGGPDENLILLDGVPVYNVNHLFGFFSVFNTDAINSVKLSKGGFPARYGGRLSSVLDIRMKEGNSKKFQGEGSVGLISSKLTLEGPIVKDKTSFIISGRRTYIDILAFPFIKAVGLMEDQNTNMGYYFYDLNAKINHKFSDRSRLYLSAYMGDDKAHFKYVEDQENFYDREKFKLKWGNITTVLRWNYIINKKLFANVRGSYTRYKFLTGLEYLSEYDNISEEFKMSYSSGIDDWSVKADFDYVPSPNHYIRFGINETYHTFNPGITAFAIQENNNNVDTTFGNRKIFAHEFDAYVEDDIHIGELIKTNIGMHFSGFKVKDKFYTSFQPRISMRYLLNEKTAIKASYAEMTQYLHLLTNSNVGLPTDLWVPVTDSIEPLRSRQFALGAVYNLDDEYEFSIESFYKKMFNLIEYKEGASYLLTNREWTEMVTTGTGEAYGLELLVKKNVGKISGWIGYTLAWSTRQFEDVSFGEKFPYRYDRRHDIGIALIFEFMKEADMGITYVFGTGNAITVPTRLYLAEPNNYNYYWGNNYLEYYDGRNNYRMPPYHRLDFGMNFHKDTKWGSRTWSFGAYNVYNRRNPFFLYFDEEWNEQTQESEKVLKQVSLFPILPYIKYSFKF